MKKSTIFLLISILCLFFTLSAAAHSGRTDSKGGHYDHSTGDYHYHHGYPPHDHYGGECPYDFDSKTNQQLGGSSSINSNKNIDIENSKGTNFLGNFFNHYSIFFFVCCFFVSFPLIKFSDFMISDLLSLNFFFIKSFIGSVIISIASVFFVNVFKMKSLNYIIPIIGLFVLYYVLCWPVRKSKYKKYRNKSFLTVYCHFVDRKGEEEYKFFNDWSNNQEYSGDYYCYTCYVAKNSKVIHYKKGCSNANIETYLPINNYKRCQKCGKKERIITLSSEKYYKFINVCDIFKFWDIKPGRKENNNGDCKEVAERKLPSSSDSGPLW